MPRPDFFETSRSRASSQGLKSSTAAWCRLAIPQPDTRRQAADAILNGVEHGDPLQRFLGKSATSSRRELPRTSAAHARSRTPAAPDRCRSDHALVGGIAVDLQDAVAVPEQLLGSDRLDTRKPCRPPPATQAAPRAVIGGDRSELADFGPATGGIEPAAPSRRQTAAGRT